MSQKTLLAGLLIGITFALFLIALLSPALRPALPQPAYDRLADYFSGGDFAILSAMAAPHPENFAGVCSFFAPDTETEMWCVVVDGGYTFASHYILHRTEAGWRVIPFFDFDRAIYEGIGCTNW